MSAKEQTTSEMLLEIIARQAEMAKMLEDQGEVIQEIADKLDEIDSVIGQDAAEESDEEFS